MERKTTCEYTISGSAEGNCDDGAYLPDAPFNIALPSVEITDDSVVIHHKNWRSRKAKPSECPQSLGTLKLIPVKRYTMGIYEDGKSSHALMRIGEQTWFLKHSL